jgi:hypothetical protein
MSSEGAAVIQQTPNFLRVPSGVLCSKLKPPPLYGCLQTTNGEVESNYQ